MLSLYSSLPFSAQEIIMTSHSDVMIVCSIFPVGKPLCMCIGTTMVCLCIHWHPCQNPLLLQKLRTSLSLFNPFSMPVTYIYIYIIYIYIYIYMCVCVCVCMCVYLYILHFQWTCVWGNYSFFHLIPQLNAHCFIRCTRTEPNCLVDSPFTQKYIYRWAGRQTRIAHNLPHWHHVMEDDNTTGSFEICHLF